MTTRPARATVFALALLSTPALAYHRQTPPIVRLTNAGDTPLPRVPAGGRRLALAIDASGRQIFRLDRARNVLEQLTTKGTNDNPSISSSGSVIAWDADCTQLGCPEPGRQIFVWLNGRTFQASHDPTGTSTNAAVSGKGSRVVFESRGDLAGNGNRTKQIFMIANQGPVAQVSQGSGASQRAALDKSGFTIVYESTGDANGADSGASQIWLQSRLGYPIVLTNGTAGSYAPAISDDARVIAFESAADLLGDRHDTGVRQIFAYETRTRTLSQITHDPLGCSGASVTGIPGDWRIGFVCHAEGYFHHVRANQTFRLPIPSGTDTPQAIAELGGHFMMVSTNANLVGAGTTAGHEVFMLNLFKLPAVRVE
jgi:hypothetical protein